MLSLLAHTWCTTPWVPLLIRNSSLTLVGLDFFKIKPLSGYIVSLSDIEFNNNTFIFCQEYMNTMNIRFQMRIWTCVRYSPAECQICCWLVSNMWLASVKYLARQCKVLSWPVSNIWLVSVKYLSRKCQILGWS